MDTPLPQIIPICAVLAFLAYSLWLVFFPPKINAAKIPPPPPSLQPSRSYDWLIPASLALGFLGFSLWTIWQEGPLGFWPNHIQNLWGNQVWIDLLCALGVGLWFLVPAARQVAMRPLPWVLLVFISGTIGLLAMLARILYLRRHPF
jgi:hypothetical protein